jgi:retinol dehydrogenase-12
MAPPNVSFSFVCSILLSGIWPTPYPNTSYTGKTVIVTGSNTGIGLEAARHFVRLGAAKVILGVRNLEKGEAAKRNIETSTLRLDVVEVWQLDLSSFAGTKDFIDKMMSLERLDVAVMNAAMAGLGWKESVDGWEEVLQVNVLSTALLCLWVLHKQLESARLHPEFKPRLVLVGSEGHELTTFQERKTENVLKVLNNKEYLLDPANEWERYPLSKLLIMYFVRELANRVPGADIGKPEVVVNMVNPGMCESELGRNQSFAANLFVTIVGKSAERGGRTLLDAAARGQESHGGYTTSCKLVP